MSAGRDTLVEMLPEVDDRDLSAFVDGELSADERRRIAEAMEASPALARRADLLRGVDRAVERYADALAANALPARLCVRRMAADRTRRRARRAMLAAAGLTLILIGGAGGWVGHGLFHSQSFATRTFVEAAAAAHQVYVVEVRHPVEVTAAEQAHLTRWLSKRVAAPISAPDLSGHGFRLVGGRLLPTREAAPAAQLMYEDADGGRVTLYAAGNMGGRPSAFRFFAAGFSEAETIYWIEPGIAYALTGALGREKLSSLANAVHKGLEGV